MASDRKLGGSRPSPCHSVGFFRQETLPHLVSLHPKVYKMDTDNILPLCTAWGNPAMD